ncbi:MAG: serine hydrolase [Candidatus Krumholzibacteriota bacterium]|nr:serine hydrolase [Candidatus Krumholzibacteriota bacterium]
MIRNNTGLLFAYLTGILFSCGGNVRSDNQANLELAGCWKGGMVQNNTIAEVDLQLRLISLKPDSTLALTAIYEIGPRCRVWEYDIEISFQNNNLSWLAHQGFLSGNGDTMYITKNWKGETSEWMFYRDRGSYQFMKQLMASETGYTYRMPDELGDGWPCSNMRAVGIEEAKITSLVNCIKAGTHGDIHSLLICRHGKLVLEEYFASNGKLSGSFVTSVFRERVHHLASVTKGVLSAICGIAVDRGCIANVEEPIYKYLPEYESSFRPESKQIRVKDLLTMTAGWDWEQFKYSWNDPRNNAAAMYSRGDAIKYVLERPIIAERGKKFKYSNGVATVMGAVLRNACGMEADNFAQKYLFQPLGIPDYLWLRYPDGSIDTDGGLALRSRDLAKIGQLFLNNGKWGRQQLISENWIGDSTERRISLTNERGYAYYWNEMNLNMGGPREQAIYAPGDGGQLVAMLPRLDMVIVITAGNYGIDPTLAYGSLIKNEILPALRYDFKQN